jgi:hypothetical protein
VGSPSVKRYRNIDEEPTLPDRFAYIQCSAGNSAAYYALSDPPVQFDFARTCSVTLRHRQAQSGDINFDKVQLVKSDLTTPITSAVSIPSAIGEFKNYTKDMPIVGARDFSSWRDAYLKITTTAGEVGVVQVDAVRLSVGFDLIAPGATPMNVVNTHVQIRAYARLGRIAQGGFVYVYKFPWGYEIINGNCFI